MSAAQFEKVMKLALRLSPAEQAGLMERLAAAIHDALETESAATEPVFSDTEITELLQVDPLPPAEVVALGLTGTWADMGIHDGAEWANEKKHRRSPMSV